jgi:hypothetical protein
VAFLAGLIWNVVTAVIVVWLLLRPTHQLGGRVVEASDEPTIRARPRE